MVFAIEKLMRSANITMLTESFKAQLLIDPREIPTT